MKKRLEGLTTKAKKLTNTLASVKFITGLAVLVLLGTYGLWQYHSSTDADRVFWGMVDNSMQTHAFTRHNYQKNGSQSVDQIIRVQTTPQQVVNSETIFEQTGVDSAVAVTENIGTPTHDFVRYTAITTAQKGGDGKALDFSSVLNIWGKTEVDQPGVTTGQLYNQSVLGVIPVGNLDAAERRQIISIMKDKGAYTYEIMRTKRQLPFGRATYEMQVTLSPVGYISALKAFAQAEGLNHLDDINPEDYASAQKLNFSVSVDAWSHQIVEIQQSQGSKNEIVSGRNLKLPLQSPPADADTIPVDELQTRLQSVR